VLLFILGNNRYLLRSSGYKSGKIKAFPQKVSKFFGNSEIIRTYAVPEPAKPLNDAQMCGSFYFYTMSNRVPFQKSYTNAPQNDMKAKIDTLLANYPDIDTAAMGFPRGWENEPLWQ
jgi:hypothetical protein